MGEGDGAPSESALGQALADVPVSEFLHARFSLLVLDFDPNLILVSGASVTREGEGAVLPCGPRSRFWDLFSPSDAERVRPLVDQALAGVPGMLKLEVPREIGTRLLRLSLLPRLIGDARSGVVLTVQDVTARRDGIGRLQALDDRLRAILAHAADTIVVIDVEGVIEGANEAAERLTGWSEAELVGRPIQTLMGEPYRSTHQAQIERYLAEGVSGILNVAPRQLPLLHKDGRTVPIELSVGEAFIAGEQKFIGVCRDITSRLEKDEALRAANAELRVKLGELETLSGGLRAQKHALQELAAVAQRAREAAESANRAKSQFVATMSHELRTPLNGILAVAEALGRRDLNAEDLDLVKIIQSSGQGLLSILNEVLDLAKVEAGALLLDPRPFSPSETVAAVADVWRFAADAKGIKLRLKAARLPAGLIGDSHRVRQILSNLTNNAIKFTERGTVTLAARWIAQDGIMRFEVIDSGPGIEPAMRERLFEPFVQAEAGTTRKHGGTGLGLAICRELSTLMGGRIWADVAETGGAKIVCELPFALAPTALIDRSSPAASEKIEPLSADGRDLLILVAEDHPLNRRVASIVLDHAGLPHEFAEDGEAAVEAVRTGRFDLVLMDVHMPKMDGLTAARAIRALPGPAGAIPIIAVTANAAAEEIAACRQAGMDDYVPKPISAAELLQRIAQHAPSPEHRQGRRADAAIG